MNYLNTSVGTSFISLFFSRGYNWIIEFARSNIHPKFRNVVCHSPCSSCTYLYILAVWWMAINQFINVLDFSTCSNMGTITQ